MISLLKSVGHTLPLPDRQTDILERPWVVSGVTRKFFILDLKVVFLYFSQVIHLFIQKGFVMLSVFLFSPFCDSHLIQIDFS